MSSSNVSHIGPKLLAVDDRLVVSETRYKFLDEALVYVPPADELHGTRHTKLLTLIEIHSAPAFDVACDMLTRTSATDDIAPNVSVLPRARDPLTGGRQLERLAFEIVNTRSLDKAGRKAALLVARGVYRVFAIDIELGHAHEWSRALDRWSMLDLNGFIGDDAFAVPLPLRALVHADSVDGAVARALLLKCNPVIEQARAQARAESLQQGFARGKKEGQAEGFARGHAELIITVLDARDITADAAARARILEQRDMATLARWNARAATCADIADVFREP